MLAFYIFIDSFFNPRDEHTQPHEKWRHRTKWAGWLQIMRFRIEILHLHCLCTPLGLHCLLQRHPFRTLQLRLKFSFLMELFCKPFVVVLHIVFNYGQTCGMRVGKVIMAHIIAIQEDALTAPWEAHKFPASLHNSGCHHILGKTFSFSSHHHKFLTKSMVQTFRFAL